MTVRRVRRRLPVFRSQGTAVPLLDQAALAGRSRNSHSCA